MKNRPTPGRSGRREASAGMGARYEMTMTKVEVVLRMNR